MDVELDGKIVTAHCPNSGSMKTLLEEGSIVYLTKSDNPNRKLKYTAEIMELKGGTFACINTQLPNHLVEEGIRKGKVKEISGDVRREVKYGEENSRIDLLLNDNIFVEVKNVTLAETDLPEVAQFPDAKTTRGAKHLRELSKEARKGNIAYNFYVVNRTDCNTFKIAEHIDPDYQKEAIDAAKAGVKTLVYGTRIEIKGNEAIIEIDKKLNQYK